MFLFLHPWLEKLYYEHGVNCWQNASNFCYCSTRLVVVFQPLPFPAVDLRRSIEGAQALEIRIPCIRHHRLPRISHEDRRLSAAAPTDRIYNRFDGHTSGMLFRPGDEASRENAASRGVWCMKKG